MIKIAIDAMGGDYGALPIVQGALDALEHKDFEAVLIGDKQVIEPLLHQVSDKLLSRINIVHCDEFIAMEQQATDSLKNHKTSIYKAIQMHKEGEVNGVVSAGHSGATMSLATLRIGRIKGILRPAIATLMPTISGRPTLLLDVGANTDCKPEHLYQFYFMGKEYTQDILGVSDPKIGLLSNGHEPSKGNELTKEAFSMLKDEPCFVGNIEGSNIFDGSIDVVICDGFTGNVVLKSSEGAASAIGTLAKDMVLRSSIISKVAAFMLKKVAKEVAKKVDYAEYGGAPLIGIDGCVIVAHGKSNEKAIKNAIFQALEYANSNIIKDLKGDFE